MQLELTEDERVLLMVALGMAMAVSSHEPGIQRGIRLLVGRIAPGSYWGLKPGEENADA